MTSFLQRAGLKRVLTGGAAAGTVGLLAVTAVASAATVQSSTPGVPMYDPPLPHKVSQQQSAVATTAAIPHFKSTVKVGGLTYSYTMAGKNPAKAVTNAATSVGTMIVPTVVQFTGSTHTWDPTVVDTCDAGASALTRTQKSPIVVKEPWTWGGTSIGTGQVTDAFQRANFWKYANPAGINPTYAVNLSVKTLPTLTINVPVGQWSTFPTSCGNDLLGEVSIQWLDPVLQSAVTSLTSAGVTPAKLPIFLLHNVVAYDSSPSNCCYLGYHSAFNTPSGIQTYAVSIYDNTRAFGSGNSDISALSHEVGEWMDDPYVNNPTPSWGNIGQVSGCQGNLEVGDPLSGTTFTNTVNGFTYHPQELAFFSWFYHQSPSLGVNGWYSDQGKFTTFAGPCP